GGPARAGLAAADFSRRDEGDPAGGVRAPAGGRGAGRFAGAGVVAGGRTGPGSRGEDQILPEQRRLGRPVADAGASGSHALAGGRLFLAGQAGSGLGCVRGAQLVGLAPSHDLGDAGAVVPETGDPAVGGKKQPTASRCLTCGGCCKSSWPRSRPGIRCNRTWTSPPGGNNAIDGRARATPARGEKNGAR